MSLILKHSAGRRSHPFFDYNARTLSIITPPLSDYVPDQQLYYTCDELCTESGPDGFCEQWIEGTNEESGLRKRCYEKQKRCLTYSSTHCLMQCEYDLPSALDCDPYTCLSMDHIPQHECHEFPTYTMEPETQELKLGTDTVAVEDVTPEIYDAAEEMCERFHSSMAADYCDTECDQLTALFCDRLSCERLRECGIMIGISVGGGGGDSNIEDRLSSEGRCTLGPDEIDTLSMKLSAIPECISEIASRMINGETPACPEATFNWCHSNCKNCILNGDCARNSGNKGRRCSQICRQKLKSSCIKAIIPEVSRALQTRCTTAWKHSCVMECYGAAKTTCTQTCDTTDFNQLCCKNCRQGCVDKLKYSKNAIAYGYISDLNHNLTIIKDNNGAVLLKNVYGGQQLINSAEDMNGSLTEAKHKAVTSTDFDRVVNQIAGNQAESITIEYDDLSLSQPFKTADELSQNPAWAAKVTDRNGAVTQFTYNGQGNVLKTEWVEDNKEFNFTYTKQGHLKREISADGTSLSYTYDKWGNIERKIKADSERQDSIVSDFIYTEHDPPLLKSMIDPRDWDAEDSDRNRSLYEHIYDSEARLQKIKLSDGREISLAYDELSRISIVSDPAGSKTKYEYDLYGNIHVIRRAYGTPIEAATTIENDSIGRTVSITHPRGVVENLTIDYLRREKSRTITADDIQPYTFQYFYNTNGDLLSKTTPPPISGTPTSPTEVRYAWDGLGNLTSVTHFPQGTEQPSEVIQYEYYPQGELKKIFRDSLETTIERNRRGRIVQIIKADADRNMTSIIKYEYAQTGALKKMIDPLGRTTQFYQDGFGRTNRTVFNDGSKKQFVYDKLNNIISVSRYKPTAQVPFPDVANDANNPALLQKKEFIYDLFGHLTQIDRWHFYHTENGLQFVGDGKISTKVERLQRHDPPQHQIIITNDLRAETIMHFDALHRLMSMQKEDTGNKIVYEYEPQGHAVTRYYSRDDVESNRSTFHFDALGRILNVEDAYGTTATYAYDSLGRVVKTTTNSGNPAIFEYDAMSRMVSQKRYLTSDMSDPGVTTAFEWKTGDLLEKITDDRGHEIKYRYDDLNRINQLVYPDQTTKHIEYNAAGELIKAVDPQQRVYRYLYDAMGNLTAVGLETPDQSGVIDPQIAPVRTFLNDALGRTISCFANNKPDDSQDDVMVDFKYDSLGNIIYEKNHYSALGPIKAVIDNRPDQKIKQRTITLFDQTTRIETYNSEDHLVRIDENGTNLVSFDRGLFGQIKSITYGNGFTQRFDWDGRGRNIRNTIYNASSRILLDRGYAYGKNRALQQINFAAPSDKRSTSVYLYDALSRLRDETHGLDLFALTPPYQTDNDDYTDHLNTASKRRSYSFDGVDNWVSIVELNSTAVTTDPNNRDQYRSFGERGTLEYDALGYLKRDSEIGTYTFDAFGKLIEFTSIDGNNSRYIYDAMGRLTGKVPYGQEGIYFSYLGPHLMHKKKSSENITFVNGGNLVPHGMRANDGDYQYFHYDRLDSAMAISSGTSLVNESRFSAYGEPTVTDSTGRVINDRGMEIIFGGMFFDHDLGGYHTLNRIYSPFLGRFLSPDPILHPGINSYAYANSLPTMLTDPLGLDPSAKKYNSSASSQSAISTFFKKLLLYPILVASTHTREAEYVKRKMDYGAQHTLDKLGNEEAGLSFGAGSDSYGAIFGFIPYPRDYMMRDARNSEWVIRQEWNWNLQLIKFKHRLVLKSPTLYQPEWRKAYYQSIDFKGPGLLEARIGSAYTHDAFDFSERFQGLETGLAYSEFPFSIGIRNFPFLDKTTLRGEFKFLLYLRSQLEVSDKVLNRTLILYGDDGYDF